MVSWTEKRVEQLVLLHKDGHSAMVIAKKLGPDFTKGMVAGKIHRLGLTAQPGTLGQAPKPKPLAARQPTPIHNGKLVSILRGSLRASLTGE